MSEDAKPKEDAAYNATTGEILHIVVPTDGVLQPQKEEPKEKPEEINVGKKQKIEKPEMIRMSSSLKEGPIVSGKDGYYQILHARDWGKVLLPSGNPDGAALSEFELEGIQLNPGFSKIPPHLWAPYVELCFYMCPNAKKVSSKFHDSQLEVQACLLRDLKTMTKWKIVVPKQVVSGVSVKAELAENIDIATGEKYTQFPPPGWVHAGSIHSHNTMSAFFSSTDDKSDSTVPGLHIVIGEIDHEKREYEHIARIMIRKTPKDVNLEDVVDLSDEPDLDFHEDVLDYIDTVVSANRKIFLRGETQEKSGDSKVGDSFWSSWSKSTSPYSTPSFLDENGKISAFLNSLTSTNSDIFDGDSFPFDDDIESIVSHTLDSGHSINDIIQSVVRAKYKHDKEASSLKSWLDGAVADEDGLD